MNYLIAWFSGCQLYAVLKKAVFLDTFVSNIFDANEIINKKIIR